MAASSTHCPWRRSPRSTLTSPSRSACPAADPGTAPTPEDPERRPTTEWLNRHDAQHLGRAGHGVGAIDVGSAHGQGRTEPVRRVDPCPRTPSILTTRPDDADVPEVPEPAGACRSWAASRVMNRTIDDRPGRACPAYTLRRLPARSADRGVLHGLPEPGNSTVPPRSSRWGGSWPPVRLRRLTAAVSGG